MIVIPARVKVVVVMVSALALAAGLLTLALLPKPAQAKAESFTASDWSAFAFTDISPCTGEPYALEGRVHVVTHYHARCKRWVPCHGRGQCPRERCGRYERCQVPLPPKVSLPP